MLYKIPTSLYREYISIAAAHKCGRVYPLSVAEGIQKGDIFTGEKNDSSNVLFWAYSGFAYLSGRMGEDFLREVYEFMKKCSRSDSRRFLLLTDKAAVQDYFRSKDVVVEKRYLFECCRRRDLSGPVIPEGYELREMDHQLLSGISGRIIPSLFWENERDFLEKGKGYCITYDNEIASWAFSAAVSSKEIDIGIETNPKYQGCGLGRAAAEQMIQYTLGQEKAPVWACHYKNTASERLAEKLGFVKKMECSIIK